MKYLLACSFQHSQGQDVARELIISREMAS